MSKTDASIDSPPAVGDRLVRFLERSPCPFARVADIARCEPWSDPQPTEERLDALSRFLTSSTHAESCDLSVLEIHSADRLVSALDGGRIIRALLFGLRSRDPSTDAALVSGISNPDWDFEFNGACFFVSLFAPFYPPTHSRCSGEPDTAFVLIQPERGFRRFGISSQLPNRRKLSEQVHRRFKKRGQHYSLGLNTDAAKALRYVKPLGLDDPPVRWWEPYYDVGADSSTISIELR